MDYNIINMIQCIKKYYSTYYPNKYDNIVVTNAARLDEHIYIATSDPYNPIVRFDITEQGKLNNPSTANFFSKTKIKFIGFIKERLCVIPKHSWNIHVLDYDGKGYKSITINSRTDLRKKIVEEILCKNPKTCKCEDCYHLIGFTEHHGFNIFVQLCCTHKEDQKLLYIIKANLNGITLDCEDNLEVTNEYNYYTLCLDNGLKENHIKSLIFTGLHYDGHKVYLISTCGNVGYLWEMSYFNNISYLAPPKLITKLRKKPVGICSNNNNLIVLCKNTENKKINYYIIFL